MGRLLFPCTQHIFHQHPKITVIVPAYKVDKFLVQCLDSIVNQILEQLEIIILDEGDHDRCREIIDEFALRDPRIVAVHQKNGGYGASCNLGIRMARGEYIAIVEGDDFIAPEMFDEMYRYAKILDADVLRTPFFEYASETGKKDCWFRQFITEHVPQNQCFSMKENGYLLSVHASIWSGLYRTSYLRKNHISFIEAKGGAYVDNGFRVQALIHAEKVAWMNQPYYYYRVDNSESTTLNYRLMEALCRWKEIHAYFNTMPSIYDQCCAPYLILDEYHSSISWPFQVNLTRQEWELLHKNLFCTSDDAIKESPVLNREQKNELLAFKQNPTEAMEIAKNIKRQGDRDAYAHLPIDPRFMLPWESISPGDNIALYGGGIVGKTFLRQALMFPYCHIVAICDQHPKNTGINPERMGNARIPVLTPRELCAWDEARYDKVLIAVEKEDTAAEIRQQLGNGGIVASKIVWADPVIRRTLQLDG